MKRQNDRDDSFSWYHELKSESGAFINSVLTMNDFSGEELLSIRDAIIDQLIVVDGNDLEEIHQKTSDLREALLNVNSRIKFS